MNDPFFNPLVKYEGPHNDSERKEIYVMIYRSVGNNVAATLIVAVSWKAKQPYNQFARINFLFMEKLSKWFHQGTISKKLS